MSAGAIDPKAIENIPSAVLEKIPAGSPPVGVQSNFIDSPTRVPVVIGVSTAFFFLALFCFSLRVYTKTAITKKWKWDDCKCCQILAFEQSRIDCCP